MISAYNTALSGMNANATRVAVSANNVANARTPDYNAQEVVQTAQVGGGVDVTVQDADNGTLPAYQPDAPGADSQGYVQMPNVDYAAEAVEQRMAVAGYASNAAVIKTLAAMDKDLLDIKA